MQSQVAGYQQAQEQWTSRLAQAEAALKEAEEQRQQGDRQLTQMVEAQRRLGLELQEGVEAREEAEAHRDQAQVRASVDLLVWCVCIMGRRGFSVKTPRTWFKLLPAGATCQT